MLLGAVVSDVQIFELDQATKWRRVVLYPHGRARRRRATQKPIGVLKRNEKLFEAIAKSIPSENEWEVFRTFLAVLDELRGKRRTLLYAIGFQLRAEVPAKRKLG